MKLNRSIVLFLTLLLIFATTRLFSQESQFSRESLAFSGNKDHSLLPFAKNDSFLKSQPEDELLQGASERKGKPYYILFSLLLPGTGEWAMGHKTLGKTFLGVDAVLWLTYFGTQQYTNVLQRDLETYAAVHAGVNTSNKNDQYWIDVGSTLSIYEFNEQKLRERDLEAVYPEGTHYDWVWESENNRRDYVEKRFDRLDWKRYTNWMIGALVLNRIISAVDVFRLIQKEKSAEQEARRSYFHVKYAYNRSEGEVFKLNLTMQF
jgi:hypothetical protein